MSRSDFGHVTPYQTETFQRAALHKIALLYGVAWNSAKGL